MTVPLHTGDRTATACAEWSVWDTRCRVVVSDPWALDHARAVVEQRLRAVDRVVNPKRAGSVVRRLLRDGAHVPARMLIDELAGRDRARDHGRIGPFPYGLAAAPAGAPAHEPAPRPWQLAVDAVARCGRDGMYLEQEPTARAWTAQRCAEAVAEAAHCGVLVSIGTDLATSGLAPVGGWRIELGAEPGARPSTVAIDGGAISRLSAVRAGQQRGRAESRRVELHRVVVPATGRTMRPAWRSITVAAANGPAASEACAGAMLRGAAAAGWLAELGLAAHLVDAGGAVRTVGGWPLPV